MNVSQPQAPHFVSKTTTGNKNSLTARCISWAILTFVTVLCTLLRLLSWIISLCMCLWIGGNVPITSGSYIINFTILLLRLCPDDTGVFPPLGFFCITILFLYVADEHENTVICSITIISSHGNDLSRPIPAFTAEVMIYYTFPFYVWPSSRVPAILHASFTELPVRFMARGSPIGFFMITLYISLSRSCHEYECLICFLASEWCRAFPAFTGGSIGLTAKPSPLSY